MKINLKQSRNSFFVILAMGLASMTSVAAAQEFKIGFINTDRIFRDANSAKTAQAKLEQEFQRREKELNDQGAQIKAAADKLEKEAPRP
jgi:outer membrane protein